MQNPRWAVESLGVGAAALLAVGGAAVLKPTDANTLWISGGAASVGAFGGSAVISRRRHLTQKLQSLTPDVQVLQQRLTQIELAQKELNQQAEFIRDRTHSLETQLQQLRQLRPAVPLPPETPPIHGHTRDAFGAKHPDRVIQWLAERDIKVTGFHTPDPLVDDRYNLLANYVGDHYRALRELLRCLKQAMHGSTESKRQVFWFAPVTISDRNFHICYSFCKQLKQAFLLENLTAPANSKRLRGKINGQPAAKDFRMFLTGAWFERFVYQQVIQSLTDQGLDYACLLNPRISYPGTPAAELDMFFLIAGQPLSIECKSGQYSLDAALTFAKHSDQLGLTQPNAIFVTLDVPDAEIKLQNRQVPTITLMTSDLLVSHLAAEVLNLATVAAPAVELPVEATPESEPLSMDPIWSKVKQRPIKAYRPLILQALTQLFHAHRLALDVAAPMTVITLRNQLSAHFGISKAQVYDVLQVMKHAHYFLDARGQSIFSVTQPIATLRSQSPARAEQLFVEEYARKVLTLDPHFFDEIAHRQQFEAIVGAKVPNAETWEKLQEELFEDQDADDVDGIEPE